MSHVFVSEPAAPSSCRRGGAGSVRQGLFVALPALGVFVTALVTRFILQETQSRLQILAFVAATALLELLRAASRRRRFNLLRWALNAAAAAAGVLLAKHVVEPGSITEFVSHLFHRAGITAPAWLDPKA